MNIREVTDHAEMKEVIENHFFDEEDYYNLEKIFCATLLDPSPEIDFPEIYFFQDRNGIYHTVVCRETICTDNLEYMKDFIRKWWV